MALLPFIDESRLLKAMEPFYSQLTEDEIRRNTLGHEYMLVSSASAVYDFFCECFGKALGDQKGVEITQNLGFYIFGSILPDSNACLPGSTFSSPLSEWDQPDIQDNHSISVVYMMPEYPPNFIFKASLLKGVRFDEPVLDEFDKKDVRNNYHGRNSYGRRRNNQNRMDAREAAGRFLKQGLNVNPEAYGYDTRAERERRDYSDPDGKRFRQDYSSRNGRSYDQRGSYYQNRSSDYGASSNGGGHKGSGYAPDSNYGRGTATQNYSSQGYTSQAYSAQGYYSSQPYAAQGYSSQGYNAGQGYNSQPSYTSQSQYSNQSQYMNNNQYYNSGYGTPASSFLNTLVQPQSSQYQGGYSQSNQGYGYSNAYQSQPQGSQGYSYSNQTNTYGSSGYSYPVQGHGRGMESDRSRQSQDTGEFVNQSDFGDSRQKPRPTNLAWNRNISSSRR